MSSCVRVKVVRSLRCFRGVAANQRDAERGLSSWQQQRRHDIYNYYFKGNSYLRACFGRFAETSPLFMTFFDSGNQIIADFITNTQKLFEEFSQRIINEFNHSLYSHIYLPSVAHSRMPGYICFRTSRVSRHGCGHVDLSCSTVSATVEILWWENILKNSLNPSLGAQIICVFVPINKCICANSSYLWQQNNVKIQRWTFY